MNITIDGVAFTPTQVTAVRSNPGFEIVTVSAASGVAGGTLTTLTFGARSTVGVHNVSALAPEFGQGILQIISGNTGSGYQAFLTMGSGSVTITSISATAVAGRIDLVMPPTSGAVASKTASGTFNVPITS